MVEWVRADGTIRAFGRGGSVALVTDGWTPTSPAHPLPYPADAGLAGRLRALELDAPATLVDRDASENGTTALDAGEHLLRTTGDGLTAAVRFAGPGGLRLGDEPTLRFSDPRPVSIGLRDANPDPETIRVPRTPAGVAAAVTAAGETLPDGPDRSLPPYRPHPPLVAFDDDASLPDPGGAGPVFAVPDDLATVLVAAPLAYYLGAELRVGADAPVVRFPTTGSERAFSRLPALASEVAAALRRVVHLDRCSRQTPGEAFDRTPLAARALTPEAVERVPPGVRYATFLDADVDASELPEWHLSTYVDASYERAQTLPSLLDRLSLVYPAEATEMEPSDLLESSLDDFFRGAVSVTPLAPELGVGRAHAWLADGEVVDAFKSAPAAYEHARSRPATGDALDVTLVLNDPEMDAELAVADVYRDHAGTVPLDVTVREELSTDELAATLERSHDFLHYVGHCEADGLRCSDGHLSASSLSRSGARAFFLNACGSYHEGERLVKRGSVAGAVTLEKVLNEQAAKVGTAFGRLVVAGYGVDRALSVARRRVMMGKDYAAVGDGTATIAPAVGEPAIATVEPGSGSELDVTYEPAPGAGSHYDDPFDDGHGPRGDPATAQLTRHELANFLQGRTLPVVFDGEFRWSESLVAELTATRRIR